MAINKMNDKCMGCRYQGIYLCTKGLDCIDNRLYQSKDTSTNETNKVGDE